MVGPGQSSLAFNPQPQLQSDRVELSQKTSSMVGEKMTCNHNTNDYS